MGLGSQHPSSYLGQSCLPFQHQIHKDMEQAGFEPAGHFHVQRFSKPSL